MTLPQEIKNHIVEQIDDSEDLRACSLAHRCLTWAAQRKLHRAIRYEWNNHGNVIADEDIYSNPNIASFVTELSLVHLPPPDVVPLAWEVISRLTNVKVLNLTICFSDEEWPWVSRANREAILRTFSNVEILRIDTCFFCHADALLFLLSAFPKVTTLRLEDVMIFYLDPEELDEEDKMRTDHEEFRQAAIKAIPCPHLRRLEMVWYDEGVALIEEAWEPFVEKWIVPLSRIAEPNFSLKWRERWLENEFGGFSKIAKALGPVMRSLDVELSRMDDYEYHGYGVQGPPTMGGDA